MGINMHCNVGKSDKVFRIIIGLVIAILGFVYQSWWGLLAIIPLGTAMMSICPLYSIFKINTNKPKE